MRQRTGSTLCSRCGRLVHVEEPVCPHCGARAPALFGFGPGLRRLFGPNADLVTLISLFCSALYVASLALTAASGQRIGLEPSLDFGSPGSQALYTLGMTGGLNWLMGGWWTLITANYLHGSLLHLVFNMGWARTLGHEAIEAFGAARFFVLWTLTGVGGFLASNLFDQALMGLPSPTIGASASIFGLLGALAAYGRRRGGSHGQGVSRQMWIWALIMGGLGFVMPGVNNLAHVGGFVSGLLLGRVMPMQERARETRVVQGLAFALGLATILAFVVSLAAGLSRW